LEIIDTCVIGGGVVGLAIARSLAPVVNDLIVVDQAPHIGQGVSSRNSEVIHAGIYYPQDSLKARFCVEGKQLLYEYCESHKVSYQRCGKLIVANGDDEEQALAGISAKAAANDVEDLQHWGAKKLSEVEPAVAGTAALYSPSTGIVSAHELMASYLGDVEANGGFFAGSSRVVSIKIDGDGFVVEADVGTGESFLFRCRQLINSAGLGAQQVANTIDGYDKAMTPELFFCKGNYFTLQGRNPFNHLIYPVPDPSGAGLGVHATLDLGGQVKFGPDVEYQESEDYSVSEARCSEFYVAIRKYFPSLEDGALVPGYAGIRPKLQGPGDPVRDFVVQTQSDHGISGLVQLFGIESPGLTSSLAIGQYVADLLSEPELHE